MSNAQDPMIVGIGMMTAVGLTARETAAAVRAAAMRFTESKLFDQRAEPFTLAEVPQEGLPPLVDVLDEMTGLTNREMRLLRLAARPLADCLASLPRTEPKPGLILALPETQTTRPLNASAFLENLWKQSGGAFDLKRSAAPHSGRAGGVVAIAHAAEAIRSGQAKFMVAGAVDTYRDPHILGFLDIEKRVKSSAALDGFIPGEGAAFLLLSGRSGASAAGLRPLAAVSRAAQTLEPGHLYSTEPYRGDGLAAAVTQLVQSGIVNKPIAEVWSSMNGENHWAKEWSVAFLRNRSAFLNDHVMMHPADCIGDTGAACGVILAGLAAVGLSAGYRRPACLVYGSSDRGGRAAMIVDQA
jgi:3-oxoacyl-[acyl-carrier-protein] synthase I